MRILKVYLKKTFFENKVSEITNKNYRNTEQYRLERIRNIDRFFAIVENSPI